MSGSFSTGLFECCSDVPICCIGMQMSPCLLGDTHSRITGQGGFGKCCLYGVLSQCCLCAIVGVPARKELREKYDIVQGSGDCVVRCFCPTCAVCQEAREVKIRSAQHTAAGSIVAPLQQPQIKY
eukprot:TRINITY_DN152_c0_g2_i1.p2 TRINITY_DN152_c0_g2~~TRINITY_DN152_c0_g2_i1.p2  ORF type:complete len:125 (+),score=20.40 TRINITY_DN152_c0_g2_i1:76-450(+)